MTSIAHTRPTRTAHCKATPMACTLSARWSMPLGAGPSPP